LGRGEEVKERDEGRWKDGGTLRGLRARRGRGGWLSCIEEGEERWGNHSGASVQGKGVIRVPVPTGDADAVVDGDIHPDTQLQSEDIRGREWVAPSSPQMAPPTASVHWTATLWAGHINVATDGDGPILEV
jgi:hypothetical protein